jgi:hypothetical protein
VRAGRAALRVYDDEHVVVADVAVADAKTDAAVAESCVDHTTAPHGG